VDGLQRRRRPHHVVDLARRHAAPRVERQDARVLGHRERDRARALGGLGGVAEEPPRHVGHDDQRPPPRVRAHPGRRQLQRRGAAVTGVFHLDVAAARPQAEVVVHVRAHRLGEVDAGLGGDDEEVDAAPVAAVDERPRRVGRQRHRIFEGGRQRSAEEADAVDGALALPARPRDVDRRDGQRAAIDVEVVDADGHAPSSRGTSRTAPAT
jgi:hypothetical protein